jgi:ATP-dependent DNA helicase DinG
MFVPEGLPDPREHTYTAAVVTVSAQILEVSRGRAFVLFTSHRALEEAAGELRKVTDFPLMVQGTSPRNELLRRFRNTPNAVLLGTNSFWEGVDVRGDALSCVIIDKLPFAAPGDPILQARFAALRRRGSDPFVHYQLSHAVLTLKQGAGRLLRDVADRGVLVVCDPRLYSKPYGSVFLESLPPMPRTRCLQDVRRFFAQRDDSASATVETAKPSLDQGGTLH